MSNVRVGDGRKPLSLKSFRFSNPGFVKPDGVVPFASRRSLRPCHFGDIVSAPLPSFVWETSFLEVRGASFTSKSKSSLSCEQWSEVYILLFEKKTQGTTRVNKNSMLPRTLKCAFAITTPLMGMQTKYITLFGSAYANNPQCSQIVSQFSSG
jgi:hypothetical protein